jgi:ATPase family AAA domain-containing protein 1
MLGSQIPDSIQELMRKVVTSVILAVVTTIIAYIVRFKLPAWSSELEAFFLEDGAESSQVVPPGISARVQNMSLTTYERQLLPGVVHGPSITESLSDVGGLTQIKEDLRTSVVVPMQTPHIFFDARLRAIDVPRGILFSGPPGTGKTMLARAIAKDTSATFFCVTLSMLENKYYGETSKLIQSLFSLARKLAPSIIFFDEIDGMLKERRADDQNVSYGFKTELLTQMDGFHKSEHTAVMVIACTNAADRLDPAVRRRLPKLFEVGLPTRPERHHILTLLTRDERRLRPNVLDALADETEGWSGSDLTDLYRAAVSHRSRRLMHDTSAFRKTLPSAGGRLTDVQIAAINVRIPPLGGDDWKYAQNHIKQKARGHLGASPSLEDSLRTLIEARKTTD